jgi:hypothetical protein
MIRSFDSAPPNKPAPDARIIDPRVIGRARSTAKPLRRGWAFVMALACLTAIAPGAGAAESIAYQGRLTDAAGAPLPGPVAVALHLHDTAGPGGTPLYSEDHAAVALDANGVFQVWLGDGAPSAGTYNATLFQSAPRYLEVVVNGATLTPRQLLGSVPTARVSETLAPPATANRFEDCGNGTVADHDTGLLWEQKANPSGLETINFVDGRDCSASPQPAECAADVHDVRNRHDFSSTGQDPDGSAFTDFLAKLNDSTFGVAATSNDSTGCFAGHCDWRLPAIGELRTILVGPHAAPGQDLSCAALPCIDPDFADVGGTTARSLYWSASPAPLFMFPVNAWGAQFFSGHVENESATKSEAFFVRAVRAGSCD